jgi:MFS family permease
MIMQEQKTDAKHLFSLPVIVAALGYFVDIYDLQLFGIVRVQSITSLVPPELPKETIEKIVSEAGTSILDFQMIGLLIGGILWGVLGDKKGRLSVLFGSIITYSIANIACGMLPYISFMDKIEAYKWLRFVAGIGLAGELGAGITLVSEVLPKELRAIGTSLVAGIGLLGAVVAKFTVILFGAWNIAYFVGGGLGFMLLLLRVGVIESGMYKDVLKQTHVQKGNFFAFFTDKERFVKYIKCIGIGLPTWFCIGILVYFCNEFGKAFGIAEKVDPGWAVMWSYVGISIGDLLSGVISHKLHSRKRAIAAMMAFALVGFFVYMFGGLSSPSMVYFMACWLGLGTGYWAMFVTVGAEQFGTNLRATAATTVPNMVRGSVVIMTFLYGGFKTGSFKIFGSEVLSISPMGVIVAGTIVGLLCFAIGFYSTLTVPETHGRDLDFVEE